MRAALRMLAIMGVVVLSLYGLACVALFVVQRSLISIRSQGRTRQLARSEIPCRDNKGNGIVP